MEDTKRSHPLSRFEFTVSHELYNLIPTRLTPRLARQTGAVHKTRSFKPWSHVVSLLFAQFTPARG